MQRSVNGPGVCGGLLGFRLGLTDIRVIVIEPSAVATDTTHITHPTASARAWTTADAHRPKDIAEVIAFAVSRPLRGSTDTVRPRRKRSDSAAGGARTAQACFGSMQLRCCGVRSRART
jgi:hypothetical protein